MVVSYVELGFSKLLNNSKFNWNFELNNDNDDDDDVVINLEIIG